MEPISIEYRYGPSKICGGQPLKNLKWYSLFKQTTSFQIFQRLTSKNFLGLFLNTPSQYPFDETLISSKKLCSVKYFIGNQISSALTGSYHQRIVRRASEYHGNVKQLWLSDFHQEKFLYCLKLFSVLDACQEKFFTFMSLRKKCPNTELFLVRI